MSYTARLRIYDCALSFFQNSDFISHEALYKGNPPDDFNSVLEYLQSEGLVNIHEHGIRITEKGKLKIRSGGFVRAYFIRNILILFSIIATIASVISAVVVL